MATLKALIIGLAVISLMGNCQCQLNLGGLLGAVTGTVDVATSTVLNSAVSVVANTGFNLGWW